MILLLFCFLPVALIGQTTKSLPTISWATPAAINYGTALSATQLDATSSVAGTFVYTPVSGTMLPPGTHSLSVTFTPTDSADYATATANVTLTVGKATPTIAWATPVAINYGTALSATQLDATSATPGTFAYSLATGTVLTAGSHTLSVTLTPTATNLYHDATATVTLTVNKATPAISWATPAAITNPTALSATQLDANSTVAGTFVYSPAAGTVLPTGSQTLSVTLTPKDSADYNAATGSVTLTVNKPTNTIIWATPVAIAYGTALNATQLDATSSVAGSFAYTPAAGTVLKAGAQTLSVTFTPTDTTDYATITATVTLTVNKATPTVSWATPASINYGTALSATQLDAASTTAGTFAYAPVSGAVLPPGTHSLSVTLTPTDSTDYTTATATVTLAVAKATPTITWAAPAAIPYGTALSATQLDATSATPGTFAYSLATGTVLTAGSHTLSVTFTPTATTLYHDATATVTLTVNKATPTISWATPAPITYGTALCAAQLNASSTLAGTFAYTPASGAVLKAGAQTLAVTFAPTDTIDYATATATVGLMVNALIPTLTWAAPAAITYGTALSAAQLNASSTVAGTFAYTPAAGTVLKAGAQTLSVTFTPTDTTDYGTATATVTLTVKAITPAITWAVPSAITYGTALSATQLNATSTVAGVLAYSPSAGTVLKTGTQTLSVTFTPTDSTDYATVTSSVSITVNAATPGIAWAVPAAINYGTALSVTQLDASSTVAGAFSYTPAAGTVLKAGTQTLSVTFTPTDTTDYKTSTATVTLTVNAATPAITWTAPAAITYGTALSAAQLDASSTVAGTFAYTPAAGTVLKAGAQPLSVTFTPTDTTDYATATATVTLTVKAVTPAITWAVPSAITYGTALSATQLDASSTVAGTFAYTPAAGTVLKAGAQTLSVSFTPTDTTDYGTATATVKLTVDAVAPTITWAVPSAITYGTALSATQLNATSTVAGVLAYSPSAGTVLKTGTQMLSVTFTPIDSTDYATVTSSVSITVNAATPVIAWAVPAAINYGTALSATQLDASSTTAGTFSYSPAASTVLTAGTHVITATFTPTDTTDYATATATVTLTVNQAAPTITWATPAAITYGAALSSIQLDASATIPGTFAYSPAAGAVLAAGSQALSVTFTPTDTTDYTTATQTVMLTVNPTSSFVQAIASSASGSANSLSISFPANTFAGDLILVGFDFSGNNTPSSVTDSQGNTFTQVGTQLTSPSGSRSVVYYARNITGGADTVTATLSATSPYILAYLTEYSGVDRTNPIDAQAGVSGSAGPVSSGNATTNFAGDVIYGYCWGDGACTVGSGFAARSTFDGNLIEDQTAGNPGSYAATGSATSGWTMQMVALKPASSGPAVPAPAITSATAASGSSGSAFSYQITASNTPTSYGATGLPAGLTVNSGTGLISGTPTTAGTSTVTLSASNSGGTGNATLTLTIAIPAPAITSATAASGTVGSAFSYQITATNTPTSYGATGLPAGLTVNSGTGLISGTPTAAAKSTVTLSATNSSGTGNAMLTLAIAMPVPAVTSTTAASGTVGSAFSYQITATNTPTSYGATGLPAGLTVNSGTGLISGTPTAGATSTVTLSATNSAGTGNGTLTLTIAAAGPTLSINATSVGFGNVALNTMATQTVTLTSAGTASVTVSSATVTGTGFSLAGSTFSATLTPGQTATLGVQFDPTTAGAVTGQLTITSNSSTNSTSVLPLTGTGTASSYAVELTWDAPSSSADPVAGYNVYRALSGSSMYQLLNSSINTQTAYMDSTVHTGQAYDYIVESVDDSGAESAPTSPVAATIP